MFGILHDSDVIRAFIVAGGGITVSELQLWTGWTEFAIKIVSFMIVLVVLANNINKYRKTMNQYDGGDNEDGSGSDIPLDNDKDEEG